LKQRIAVWRRTHDRLGGDIAAAARPVLDDKWLAAFTNRIVGRVEYLYNNFGTTNPAAP
jgi:hypothetical protein